jgi:hypothetical protein
MSVLKFLDGLVGTFFSKETHDIDFTKIIQGWGGVFFNDLATEFPKTDWQWVEKEFRNILLKLKSEELLFMVSEEDAIISIIEIESIDVGGIPVVVFTWSASNNHCLKVYLSIDDDRTFISNKYEIGADESSTFYPKVKECFLKANQKIINEKER